MTKGTINVIWHSADGSLHPQILPNLEKIVGDAAKNAFDIALWTDTQRLVENHKVELARLGVKVKDYRECSSSRFYPYVTFFLEKAFAGDKTAFALASDVLRMSILELSPDDQYYIYMDGNDLKLLDLDRDLKKLEQEFEHNRLGFSFPIEKIHNLREEIFHIRNDFLLALKNKDKEFFENYFKAYEEHLSSNAFSYKKPITDGEAQDFANNVTMSTSSSTFFLICKFVNNNEPFIQVKFGKFSQTVFSGATEEYFTFTRDAHLGNTWLPLGLLEEEKALLEKEIGAERDDDEEMHYSLDEDENDHQLFEAIKILTTLNITDGMYALIKEGRLEKIIEDLMEEATAVDISSEQGLQKKQQCLEDTLVLARVAVVVSLKTSLEEVFNKKVEILMLALGRDPFSSVAETNGRTTTTASPYTPLLGMRRSGYGARVNSENYGNEQARTSRKWFCC